jgi:hypothetical protein
MIMNGSQRHLSKRKKEFFRDKLSYAEFSYSTPRALFHIFPALRVSYSTLGAGFV